MEANVTPHDLEDQEEYVMLDLDAVSGLIDIPPNAKHVLTGLDTLHPVLIIDDKLKLIGEYEETIATCIALTEQGYSGLLVVKDSMFLKIQDYFLKLILLPHFLK